ncbi:MAG TPA: sensor histidine kinase [Anaerolineaceae bacterium]|nr:sensor histidine kinase [Anaerolineaceae bacterium]
MRNDLSRNRWTVIDTVSYLIIGSVFGRMLPYYLSTAEQWIVIGGLSLYLVLFTLARILSRRFPIILYPYFVLQVFIALFLTQVIARHDGPQDYFTILVLPLCVQAMWRLPRKTGTIWVGVFCVIAAASMIVFYLDNEGTWEGIGYGLAYVAVCLLISVFSMVTLRAEEARAQSQALNVELQQANEKLQQYTHQAEEMAAAEERNRLARDLHDSVSQTIFSMTLTAQAARILLDRDPQRVGAQLDHLQVLANHALGEMRSLIQHLRPGSLDDGGLAACLRRHVEERKNQDGLFVDLQICGCRRLPIDVEEGLFRVTQEALNNVVKHAQVDTARVVLKIDKNPIELCIEDHGVGFDPLQTRISSGHIGLAGMMERIQALGGRMEIESMPGRGTRVWVGDLNVEDGNNA